jgi:hypothetical protein
MKTPALRLLLNLLSPLTIAAFGCVAAVAQSVPAPNPQLASKEVNARVESLLKQMT